MTGGNNGIGLYTCSLLASLPAYHVIMGSRSIEKGQKAIAEIKSQYPNSSISSVKLDIDSDDSIAAAVDEVKSRFGRLDILVNNAGICPLDFSRTILREALETNTISPAMVTREFAALLGKSSDPRIIYISSRLGSITLRFDPNSQAWNEDYKSYRISKAAMNMLVACDTWEYGKKGYKVFAYHPGYVLTDLANMREEKSKKGVATPESSARGILAIVQGKRDSEVGGFLHGEEAGLQLPW